MGLRAGRLTKNADLAAAAALGVALALLFWSGRSRSFGPGDSPQHVFCALLWAVPHPPGYPLQTALGWAWSRLFSDPGAAVNGLSGILHAAAAGALFLLLRREGCRAACALAAIGLMALSPLFWYYSLVAEVRALNDLLALLSAFCALEWTREGDRRWLYALAAAFGLGLSHHPTFPLIAPACAVWLLRRHPTWRRGGVALVVMLAALALPYALLAARLAYSSPAFNLFQVSGFRGMLDLFLRRRLGGPLRMAAGPSSLILERFSLAGAGLHARWFAESVWQNAGPSGLALAALGAASLWKRDRRRLAGWTLWLAVPSLTVILFGSAQLASPYPGYARAVIARFHLLPMIGLFTLAGAGADWLASRSRPVFSWALAASFWVFPLLLRPLSLARENPLLDYMRGLLRDSRPGDMIVLGSDDTNFAALDLDLARGEADLRIFLSPSMFAAPDYARWLSRRYPDLVLPSRTRGLPVDWELWKSLNPGRALLLEPSLLEPAIEDFPRSIPQGTLVRIESRRVPDDPKQDAIRFLDAPETWSVTRSSARLWTQEVYVLDARRRMALWLAARLGPGADPGVVSRLGRLLAAL